MMKNVEPWSDLAIGYIAGIFDGEGCFITGSLRGYVRAHATITSTDLDILEHTQWCMGGMGQIHGPYEDKRKSRKLKYQWTLGKAEDLYKLIITIFPYLCDYKQQRAIKCLEVIESNRPKPKPCLQCGTNFLPCKNGDSFVRSNGKYCSLQCGQINRRNRKKVLI